MRNIIILLILALYPIVCFAAIDEYKTDVYFANGILTKEMDASANTDLLRLSIINEVYNNNKDEFKNNIGKVIESYNHTNGGVLDLWESIAQKLNFQELIDAILDTSHGRDLTKQVTAYKDSIEDGHKVLVVAHSQGNLFTAEALDSLEDWMHDYFYAVSVASPKAFKIKSDTPHIAFDNDIVPWLGGVYIATDNPNDEVGSIESHAFTYYMGLPSAESNKSTDVAKTKIMDSVKKGLDKLDKTESQWKTDELNEAGKEHLIKITHKFDFANIAMFEDVYPFDSTKKLYQVNGEYVKASCGGTKILDADYDTWANKKSNEFYYLEGTGETIFEEAQDILKYDYVKLIYASRVYPAQSYYIHRVIMGLIGYKDSSRTMISKQIVTFVSDYDNTPAYGTYFKISKIEELKGLIDTRIYVASPAHLSLHRRYIIS